MSLGPGNDNPSRYPAMLASRADRDATQAALENAFADERLTQDEFESRVGRALSARTLADLAELTRDLPVSPGQPAAPGQFAVPGPFTVPGPARRPGRRVWWLVSGIAAVVVAAVIGLFAVVSPGGVTRQSSAAPAPVVQSQPAAAASSGPARCPVGTSATAVAIANALVTDPLYVNAPAKQVSAGQARRIRARIARADPGRIRVAAVTGATLRRGGGARALANSIGSCPADSAGTVLVATPSAAYLVTSYADYKDAAQAVQSALNTNDSLGAGLLDAVGRIAEVDPGH
jgi:Domain of unknown function (DUF1707)